MTHDRPLREPANPRKQAGRALLCSGVQGDTRKNKQQNNRTDFEEETPINHLILIDIYQKELLGLLGFIFPFPSFFP